MSLVTVSLTIELSSIFFIVSGGWTVRFWGIINKIYNFKVDEFEGLFISELNLYLGVHLFQSVYAQFIVFRSFSGNVESICSRNKYRRVFLFKFPSNLEPLSGFEPIFYWQDNYLWLFSLRDYV